MTRDISDVIDVSLMKKIISRNGKNMTIDANSRSELALLIIS